MSQAHILVVDDEPDIRELVSEILEDEGYAVSLAEDGAAARLGYARSKPDLVLLDIWMPDVDGISLLKEWSANGLTCPVVIMTGHGSLETAVEATRLGAHDFVQKPISLAKLLAIVKSALASKRAGSSTHKRDSAPAVVEIVGNSHAMRELRQKAEHAAPHDSPALITGEAGSGRELLARYLHFRAGRSGPFIALDRCELQSDHCREYLLSGEQGGTGGAIKSATGGTLFIPDIQDLPSETLKLLFQALETSEASNDNNEGDIPAPRFIGSGADNLAELAQNDPHLERLYFKLNVLPLHVPALRDRPEDVPDLLRYYSEWFPEHEDLPYRPFSVSAQNRLRNHTWPGNCRELTNFVQQLLMLGGEGEIQADEVEEALSRNPVTPSSQVPSHPEIFDLPLREAREAFERDYLLYQLRKVDGSVGRLAENVGMERTHLYRKLRGLNIDPKTVGRDTS